MRFAWNSSLSDVWTRIRIRAILFSLFIPSILAFELAAPQAQDPSPRSNDSPSPADRAIAYLASEVRAWPEENHCFSCHNSGDGARALFFAIRRSVEIPRAANRATAEFLAAPRDWDDNKGEAEYSNKMLEAVQFAAALGSAYDAGLIEDRSALIQAADRLVAHQADDGSWPIEVGAVVGSPVTYGARLATVLARRALARADPERFKSEIERADAWLDGLEPRNVFEAAIALMAEAAREVPESGKKRSRALELIVEGERSGGGWGPYTNSAPEPFDTALVLLGLAESNDLPNVPDLIRRGREYLTRTQLESGGWPETTRPRGYQSYAQHISTTAWAAMALLATR